MTNRPFFITWEGRSCDAGSMNARALLTHLCDLIDAHRWTDLPPLLTDDFVCRYVHTGETFDRDSWVRLNAEYPGFDRMVLHDLVGFDDRAVARCHVTAHAQGRLAHFEVATFITARGGRIGEMTEVWTDAAQPAPGAALPGTATIPTARGRVVGDPGAG